MGPIPQLLPTHLEEHEAVEAGVGVNGRGVAVQQAVVEEDCTASVQPGHCSWRLTQEQTKRPWMAGWKSYALQAALTCAAQASTHLHTGLANRTRSGRARQCSARR